MYFMKLVFILYEGLLYLEEEMIVRIWDFY